MAILGQAVRVNVQTLICALSPYACLRFTLGTGLHVIHMFFRRYLCSVPELSAIDFTRGYLTIVQTFKALDHRIKYIHFHSHHFKFNNHWAACTACVCLRGFLLINIQYSVLV